MSEIKYQLIEPGDIKNIEFIAGWYLSQWNIPFQITIEKTKNLSTNNGEFQVLMTLDDKPISTGGLYNHPGLLDNEPKFKFYKNWLTLVYTIPKERQKGYGALICNYIQDYSKKMGFEKMYLFTDTAERLYNRLGWTELERLQLGNRNVVIMEKNLNNYNNNTNDESLIMNK